jgi:hypothetical protein
MRTGHHLLAVGDRPLHPTETLLIAMATARGVWVRHCSCGINLFGANECDVFVRWREHRDNVARLAAERGLQ